MQVTPFRWTPAHVAAIGRRAFATAPLITHSDVRRVVPGVDLWDHWPVLEDSGAVAEIAGGSLVIALSAPTHPDPDARHGVARLRLLHRRGGMWADLGPLLPNVLSPGSREWAGSAEVDRAHRRLTVYFTAAGVCGEQVVGFDQALFVTSAGLDPSGEAVTVSDWTRPEELVRPDGCWYETELAGEGKPGTIKAFRDPFVCRAADGRSDRLLFAASRSGSASRWNGLVGSAERTGDRWTLLPPIVDAEGVNNELERPHAIVHAGRTYLFWSTQATVFAPELTAPTGLYGIVADGFGGPWRPLNGDGLVFGNPPQAPRQAYSWQVLPDLQVWSFADRVSTDACPGTAGGFVGGPAPILRLRLRDDEADLV